MSLSDLERSWSDVEPTVRGYLHRRLGGDQATTDDLSHEVFLRMQRGLDKLESIDRIGPWASRIARSVLIDHVRRRRTHLQVDGLEPEAVRDGEEPEDLPLLAAFLRTQVDALPGHERAAIRAVDLEGVAPAEAARHLGIGMPALKARLRRGRLHLRQAIDRCCALVLDGRGRPIDCEPRHPEAQSACAACTDSDH